ncbi:hypothetical protein ABE354_22195 [Brevibacillus laterosporus]|uniref:hypothetical protein n=1 Tax=Brevibacillus laterosporus TaxID=1465 RepID=UPI003D1E4B8F
MSEPTYAIGLAVRGIGINRNERNSLIDRLVNQAAVCSAAYALQKNIQSNQLSPRRGMDSAIDLLLMQVPQKTTSVTR